MINKKRTKSTATYDFSYYTQSYLIRGGSAAKSKVEIFVIVINGFRPLAIITKSSTFDVAAVLDPPLLMLN